MISRYCYAADLHLLGIILHNENGVLDVRCVSVCVSEHAEADSFWCFTNLMSEIRDNFIKHLDDSECGIGEWECVNVWTL